MSDPVFSRRALTVAALLGGTSLLAGFGAVIFGAPGGRVTSYGPDSFSTSAIGHAALVELLERSGRHVVLSRGRSAAKAADRAALVLLEPGNGNRQVFDPRDLGRRVADMIDGVERCLVVLPKWLGQEDEVRDGWIQGVRRVPLEEASEVLAAVDPDGSVARLSSPPASGWTSAFGPRPAIDRPQVVDLPGGTAWVYSHAGALLVELREAGKEVWVLGDPDLLSNHGLAQGDNAVLAMAVFDEIAPVGEPIVIDETLHGFTVAPNLWSELGRPPLVLALVQTLIALAAVVWAGMARFGAPRPDAAGPEAGKAVLIDNTTELLLSGGHTASVLRRYHALAERRVAAALHLPADAGGAERAARMRQISEARGARSPDSLRALVAAASEGEGGSDTAALRAAREVQRWTQEVLDGSR